MCSALQAACPSPTIRITLTSILQQLVVFGAAVVLGLMVRYYFVIWIKQYLVIILVIYAFHYYYRPSFPCCELNVCMVCAHPLLDIWVVRQRSAACSPTRTEQFEPELVASDWKSGHSSGTTLVTQQLKGNILKECSTVKGQLEVQLFTQAVK